MVLLGVNGCVIVLWYLGRSYWFMDIIFFRLFGGINKKIREEIWRF